MDRITFVVPSKNNLRYLKWSVDSIRKNAHRKDHAIFAFVDAYDDGTDKWCEEYAKEDPNFSYYVNPGWERKELYGIGKAYDYGIEHAETDVVMVWHADMYLCPGADVAMWDELEHDTLVCATRIEPPLHPEGPEKIVKDFGMWPEPDVEDGFKEKELIEFANRESSSKLVTKGAFAPWMVWKKDFLELGGHDPIMKSAREDSDVFNRMVLAGWSLRQSWASYVYHLTCRGGQFQHGKLTTDYSQKSDEWRELMENSTKEFVRKWGSFPAHDEYMHPIIPPKYDISFVVKNMTDGAQPMLGYLEPFCDRIYIDNAHLLDVYPKLYQHTTAYELTERVLRDEGEYEGGVVVTFDYNKLSKDHSQIIKVIPQMLEQSGQLGQMSFDIFEFDIRNLDTYEKNLIFINDGTKIR